MSAICAMCFQPSRLFLLWLERKYCLLVYYCITSRLARCRLYYSYIDVHKLWMLDFLLHLVNKKSPVWPWCSLLYLYKKSANFSFLLIFFTYSFHQPRQAWWCWRCDSDPSWHRCEKLLFCDLYFAAHTPFWYTVDFLFVYKKSSLFGAKLL